MPIGSRIAKYFVTDADLQIDGERTPVRSQGNNATHLIDGQMYFGALRTEVDALKLPVAPGGPGRFFYFTNWVLMLRTFNGKPEVGSLPSAWDQQVGTKAFKLDDSSGAAYPDFIDELAAMAAAGVDVRALPWVSPHVLRVRQVAEAERRYNNYAASLLSVLAIRAKPGMAHSAALNLLAHPLGAIHMKMVLCGDSTSARAYISGIDFERGRVDSRPHPNGWHDAGIRLEGPAVESAYGAFQKMWNEQLSRDPERFRFGDDVVASHDESYPEVPDRGWLPLPGATKHVQVLRTLPVMNLAVDTSEALPFPKGNSIFKLLGGFARPPIPFAPEGIFEFRAALRKAIAAAETYIYVEDQSFTSREIMEWIRLRMLAKPDLKVIFVYGGDPTDPPSSAWLLNLAVNEHLSPPGTAISDRVAFYFRTDVVVHSKTWIIDDEFAIIGSANMMRRSLYTDGELSVSVLDENEGPGSFAVDYRADLWAEHCGVYTAAGRAAFTDLGVAIRIWDPTWTVGGAAGAAPGALRPVLTRRRVPFTFGPGADQFPNPIGPANAAERKKADSDYAINDGDSREAN